MTRHQKPVRKSKWEGRRHSPGSASDLTVWGRAAFHYETLAKKDSRPGIRIWAAERAAECAAKANAARDG